MKEKMSLILSGFFIYKWQNIQMTNKNPSAFNLNIKEGDLRSMVRYLKHI